MKQEEKIKTLLKDTKSVLVVNLYLKTLAGFRSLKHLYGMQSQDYPQTNQIITEISQDKEKQIIDNITLIVKAIDKTLPEKYREMIFPVYEAFACNLWVHEFLNDDWANIQVKEETVIQVKKEIVLSGLFSLMFKDFASKNIINAKHSFLPYDSAWGTTPAPLKDPETNQKEIDNKIFEDFAKYFRKHENEIPPRGTYCDFLQHFEEKNNMNFVSIKPEKQVIFQKTTLLNSTIKIYSRLKDRNERLFYSDFTKFRLYNAFLDFFRKEKDNELYKELLHAFFVYEFERATLLNTMFMLPAANLYELHEHLVESPFEGLYNLVAENPNVVKKFTRKMVQSDSSKYIEASNKSLSASQKGNRFISSNNKKDVSVSKLVNEFIKKTDTPEEIKSEYLGDLSCMDSKSATMVYAGNKIEKEESKMGSDERNSPLGRSIQRYTENEINYFFPKWNEKRKIKKVIYFIDHAELLEDELIKWLGKIQSAASTPTKPTEFWLLNRHKDGWTNLVSVPGQDEEMGKQRLQEINIALKYLYPVFRFDKSLAALVLKNFGIELTDSIWESLISADEPFVKSFAKNWYYILEDERVEKEIESLTLDDFSDELVKEIIEYLHEVFSKSDESSDVQTDIKELYLDIPTYWIRRGQPDEASKSYLELFARALSAWDQDFLSLLTIYGYKHKTQIEVMFPLSYEDIIRGYQNWQDIAQSIKEKKEISEFMSATTLAERLAEFIENEEQAVQLLRASGHVLKRKKLFNDARKMYRKSCKICPKEPLGYIALAKTYLKERKFTEAIRKCHKAIELSPKTSDGYLFLVDVYRAQKNINKQIETYKLIAKKIKDSKAPAYKCIVELYLKQKDTQKAFYYFKRLMKYSSEDSNYSRLLGEICSTQKSVKKQLSICHTIINKFGNRAYQVHALMSSIHLKHKDYEQALKECDKAIEVAPNKIEGYAHKTYVFNAMMQFNSALRIHKKIASKFKDAAPTAHVCIAKIYFKQKKLEKAITECKKAIKIAPNDINGYAALQEIYRKNNQFDEALEVSNQMENKFHKHKDEILYGIGCVYIDKEEFKKAMKFFQEVIEEYPTSILGYDGLVKIHRNKKNLKKEFEVHCIVAEKVPEHAFEANLFIADYLLKKKAYEDALETCKKVIRLKPEVVDGYSSLLVIYRESNRLDEALEVCNQMLKKFQTYKAEIFYNIGSIYVTKNDFKKAMKFFQKVIEGYPTNILGYQGLAKIYSVKGNFNKELEVHCIVAEKFPEHAFAANLYIADVFLRKEGYEDALEACKKAIKLKPGVIDGYYKLSDIYEAKNDTTGGLQANRLIAKKFEERKRMAYYNIAKIYKKQKKRAYSKRYFVKAASMAEEELKLHPKDENIIGLAVVYYCEAYSKKQALEKSRPLLKRVSKRNHKPRHLFNLACGYSKLQMKVAMLWALKLTIKFEPGYKEKALKDEDFEYYWKDPDFKQLACSS